jgi:acyl transferase domain-containing protein
MCDDHKHQLLKDVDNVSTYAATASSSAVLANRISWFFDLVGASITMDTACSSSLIALHIAVQGLVLGETSMVSLSLHLAVALALGPTQQGNPLM